MLASYILLLSSARGLTCAEMSTYYGKWYKKLSVNENENAVAVLWGETAVYVISQET